MKLTINQPTKKAGILILCGIIIGVFSITPSIEYDSYLHEVITNKTHIFTAAFFQSLLVPTYIGFALILYPILRSYNKTNALGFVVCRFMAGTFQLIGTLILPIFVVLSKYYTESSIQEHPMLSFFGTILKSSRDLTNHLGVILPTVFGNLLFYSILLKEKLISIWLSIWGIIANVLILLGSFLLLFQYIHVTSIIYGLFSLPLVIQEVILAFFFIGKGFNKSSK